MKDKVSATLGIAALYNLVGKSIKVEFKDDAFATGTLSLIGTFDLSITDGSVKDCTIPSWIELDGEPTYRWRLENLKSIQPHYETED